MVKGKFLIRMLSVSLAISVYAVFCSYEITLYDYRDLDTRNQLIAMVTQDPYMQKMIHLYESDARTYFSVPQSKYQTKILIYKIIIDEKSVVCGFLVVQFYPYYIRNQSVGLISKLAVHKDHRCHGIAQILMQEFEIVCKKNNLKMMLLFVNKDNQSAIRLYVKYGFILNEKIDNNRDFAMIKAI